MIVEPTGVKVHVKVDDSMSNRSRDIQLPHFVRTTTTTTTTPADGPYDNRAKRAAAFWLKKMKYAQTV